MRSLKSRGGLTRGKGFTPSVRMLWLQSMHACSAMHNAMSDITNHHHSTSDQHEEMGISRIKRDHCDLRKLKEWFNENDPFDVSRQELQSLSTGLINDENITCDDVERIGEKLQDNLNGVSIAKASIIRKEQITSLSSLTNVIRLKNDKVNINPVLLFTRLIVLAERYDDIRSYFEYELTAYPTSLFHNNFMRKPIKALLIESIIGKKFQNVDESEILSTDHNVVDRGALLRKITLT